MQLGDFADAPPRRSGKTLNNVNLIHLLTLPQR